MKIIMGNCQTTTVEMARSPFSVVVGPYDLTGMPWALADVYRLRIGSMTLDFSGLHNIPMKLAEKIFEDYKRPLDAKDAMRQQLNDLVLMFQQKRDSL